MSFLPMGVLYAGRIASPPDPQSLRAGPLTLIYDEGSIRSIRCGPREVLRHVYVAVRDRNWDTVPAALSEVRVEAGANGFEIGFRAECRMNDIHFAWKGSIRGSAQGVIRFTLDGEARSTFLRNRIGFCVLHPIRECAGRPCVVERVNGAITKGIFPRYIYPHPPFQEIRAISHEAAPGLRARVLLEGDVFEMEDQRNWGDASYKIYGTPLRLPFPVEVKKGTRLSQSVTIEIEGAAAPPALALTSLPISVGSAPVAALPRLGLGLGEPLGDRDLGRIKALGPSHLRVDLRPSEPDAEELLRRAAAEASLVGASLELAVHLVENGQNDLRRLATLLAQIKPPLSHALIFHAAEKSTTRKWIALAREILGPRHPGLRLGAGTNAYFAELNRGHPPADVDLVAYSLNPQVHAFDDYSLAENLEGFASTVESARLIAGKAGLAVGPVTLRPRFNPNATEPESAGPSGQLPASVDPRQQSLFGAAWTLGALRALAQPDVASITFYETAGRRGVLMGGKEVPSHPLFPAEPGWAFPLYHVLADVAEFAGGGVLPWTSGRDLVVEGLALSKSGRYRILLGNLTSRYQKVRLACPGSQVLIKALDETTAQQAMTDPEAYRAGPGTPREGRPLEVTLLPYAVLRIDSA